MNYEDTDCQRGRRLSFCTQDAKDPCEVPLRTLTSSACLSKPNETLNPRLGTFASSPWRARISAQLHGERACRC